jgi:hypothetical protein
VIRTVNERADLCAPSESAATLYPNPPERVDSDLAGVGNCPVMRHAREGGRGSGVCVGQRMSGIANEDRPTDRVILTASQYSSRLTTIAFHANHRNVGLNKTKLRRYMRNISEVHVSSLSSQNTE